MERQRHEHFLESRNAAEEVRRKIDLARRQAAVLKVQTAVRENASGIILEQVADDDYALYHEEEERSLQRLGASVGSILTHEVVPAIRAYVAKRFPDRVARNDEGANQLDDTLSVEIFRTPTEQRDITGERRREPGERLASYLYENADGTRKIQLYLEDILEDYPGTEIDEEGLKDVIFQVLLHEMVHSASTVAYLSGEEEAEERRAMEVRSTIETIQTLQWQYLAFRVGFSYHFIAPKGENGKHPYDMLAGVTGLNEGFTDILAARIYREYAKSRGKGKKSYRISYVPEARDFYRSLRARATALNMDPNELFRILEEGFFFFDPEDIAFCEHVQEMVQTWGNR